MFSRLMKLSDLRRALAGALFALACLTAVPQFAAAQDISVPAAPWEEWAAEADRAAEVIDAGVASSEALADLRKRLEERRDAARKIAAASEAEIAKIEAEIAALGPAPAEGETEPEEAASLRKQLNDRLAAYRARLGRARAAETRAETLLADLTALTQRQFIDKLETRGPTPFAPGAFADAGRLLAETYGRIERETDRALNSPSGAEMLEERLPFAALALIGALFILFGLRGAAIGAMSRTARAETTGRSRLVMLGAGATAARLVIAASAAGLAVWGVASTGLLGAVGGAVLTGVSRGVLYLVIAYALAAALFSPQAAGLRLSSIEDRDARKAFILTMLTAAALAASAVVNRMVEAMDANAEARAALYLIVIVAASVCFFFLVRIVSPEKGEANDMSGKVWRVLRRAALTVAVAAPLAALLGYEFAARTILFPTIYSAALIAGGFVIFAFIREAVEAYLSADEDRGDRLRLIPVFVGFVLLCAALPLLALIWGASMADLWAYYDIIARGLVLGDIAISPLDFVMFALVFGVGYTLTRMLQRVLSGVVLPKTGMTSGGASALTSGVGYVGVIIAAFAAISATGLDLSNLAIVAGALSVGVGFGLQTIVNNFVSGIILLIERPIKVGDWIDVGAAQGYVKKVNVRSTEIQTFDKSSYIIPNSDLIASPVLNWTHEDTTGRVIVPVGVAYGTDPRLIERILLELGRAHPLVVAAPAPVVFFMGFGPDSLDFELRVHLRDVNFMMSVKSDLNFAIAKRFEEEGIEIPFAQRDLHIKDMDKLAAALRGEAAAPEPTPAPPVGEPDKA